MLRWADEKIETHRLCIHIYSHPWLFGRKLRRSVKDGVVIGVSSMSVVNPSQRQLGVDCALSLYWMQKPQAER